MEVLLEQQEAGVADVRRGLPNPPSYDAVRTTLRILEEKGLVRHREEGRRYVYSPGIDTADAREAAMNRLIRTFFSGSALRAALALLDRGDLGLEDEEVRRLEDTIREIEEARHA